MMGAGLASRMRWSILCGVALMAIALGWVATASAATSDRILMHRNGLRGVSYQQLSVAGAPASSAQLSATKIRQFSLDGDGQTNVRANMYPIQVNGGWGFVHFNGYRIMRVFDSSGRKLWQITNPSGRVHRSWSHRDTLAIMGSSIVHCWLSNGQRILVKRDGRTGAVIKTAVIPGGTSSSECQIAAFNLADIGQPLIFVATKSATAKCKQNYEDTWSGTIAYDQNLNLKWRRDTCDAGHYVWAPEPTGTAVYNVMVGKYYVNSQGQILCTLGGWGVDHVDSMSIGDADPSISGFESIAVGASGTRMYNLWQPSGKRCTPLWSKGNDTFYHAQYVFFAKLQAGKSGLNIAIREEPSQDAGTHYLYFTDYKGNKINTIRGTHYSIIPMQNTNLDGARGTDELSGAYGEVIDISGKLRLSRSWYWGLQSLTASERTLIPPDQWTARPIWFDMDSDGREELITWGRNMVVIGKIH
ncbi:MAG: hypothetical protein U1E45_24885 [Geminicoccaceae bacterium]